ncbi:predicted protein [Nematostella vectensis]|uniref:Diphosphomevalonate decarboxylase n=2 Tax=Nematostella vectensis TaxID=45351 RepID=A7SHV3_NEMVE|nr:predicted protein [Nematostella vectensis]|eukprot:XP_001628780.1 predicted protein [Nematostella vectensis]
MADDLETSAKRQKTEQIFRVTVKAPINIAVIKYWGKRDEELILPLNSSLSATINLDELCTTTTVVARRDNPQDSLWINKREQPIAESPRIQKCISKVRQLAKENSPERWQELRNYGLCIYSKNNFPTAAGLASSASGYACLVLALSKLYHLDMELSSIARQGSGSACRSMYGGFVKWEAGCRPDGTDSIASQIVDEKHWSTLRILILVINDERKANPSTSGMRRSTETSELLQFRAQKCVPKRMENITKAIKERDFHTFAEITMKDSNQLHAVCQDTYPPITPPYMNSTSHLVVQLVTAYNNNHGNNKVAYTFDAGPNSVLFTQEGDLPELVALIKHFFPPASGKSFVQGIPIPDSGIEKGLLNAIGMDPNPSSIKYVISTKVGRGPILINDNKDHLLDATGNPFE